MYEEITRRGAGATEFMNADWLTVRPPGDQALVTNLGRSLDLGEAEAIALALETDAILLIDERRGRE